LERKLKAKLPSGKFVNVPAVRSKTMAAIRGKHNKTTERALRMALVRSKMSGWILHALDLPGKPDLLFRREKLAIFVHGCFWHGCLKCGHLPKTRRLFWQAKITRNKQRDRMNTRKLKKIGFRVLHIWEHSLKNNMGTRAVLKQIRSALR
jgi:DNA mismatch endonuclease, patch repair protein